MNITCKECSKLFEGRGNAKYCSKLCLGRNSYEQKMLTSEWRLSKLLAMAKNRATTKGHKFDLDLDCLLGLWDGHCALSGIKLELGRFEKGTVHPYAPSIDRIEPSLGYTKGNVRIVCYQMNVAMSEFGLEQFESFIKLYVQNGVSFK